MGHPRVSVRSSSGWSSLYPRWTKGFRVESEKKMYQSVTSFSLSFLSCCIFFCTFFFVNSSIGDICEVLTSPVPAFLDHLTLFSFIGLTFVRPIKVDIEESVLSRCYFLSFFSLSLLVSLSPFTT